MCREKNTVKAMRHAGGAICAARAANGHAWGMAPCAASAVCDGAGMRTGTRRAAGERGDKTVEGGGNGDGSRAEKHGVRTMKEHGVDNEGNSGGQYGKVSTGLMRVYGFIQPHKLARP